MRKCVVIGMGLVSCLGIGVADHFEALTTGRSGIAAPISFDPTGFKPIHVGEVSRKRLCAYANKLLIPPSSIRHRKELLTAVAMSEAWRDAFGEKASAAEVEPNRIAVIVGNGLILGADPVDWIFDEACPDRIPRKMRGIDDVSTAVEGDGSLQCLATISGARGQQIELNSACAASGQALGLGLLMIQSGQAELVIVGGVDAMIHPVGIAGFQLLGATSTRCTDSAKACRPFDRRRDGTVIGEGAAVLILESEELAERQGHLSWGYLEGTGFSADGFSVVAPDPKGFGAKRSMEAALSSARRKPWEIQYINAHGTGTRLNDEAEIYAIKEVFGESAYQLWISSTKPATGHLVAAAGVLEAAITLLTLNSGVVFPTINLEQPDPALDLNFVALEPRRCEIKCALSNSFGLGGQTSSVILSAPKMTRLTCPSGLLSS